MCGNQTEWLVLSAYCYPAMPACPDPPVDYPLSALAQQRSEFRAFAPEICVRMHSKRILSFSAEILEAATESDRSLGITISRGAIRISGLLRDCEGAKGPKVAFSLQSVLSCHILLCQTNRFGSEHACIV
jgi:hypothetical protein